MSKKQGLTSVFLIVLILSTPAVVFAQATVGVKAGNWVEYNVTSTGTPMEGHDATWAKMTIDGIDGPQVNVTFSSRLTDGTIENATEDLDFATGRYIDYFLVPAGLQNGDSFYDNYLGNNVSVFDMKAQNCAGADRTVISGKTSGETYETNWTWDQATGVLVEAHSTYPDFTLHTVIDKTDLWAPQTKIFGLDPLVFYALLTAIVAAITVVGIAVRLRKKNTPNRL